MNHGTGLNGGQTDTQRSALDGDEPSRRRTCKGPRNARKDSKKGTNTNSVYSTSAQAKKEPNTSDVKEMDASCFQ